jgi:hypothetical protein
MRAKIPFPKGPGDWRYDPSTGRLIDASKTPPEEVTVGPERVLIVDGPAALESAPVEQIDADDNELETTERTAEPGAALPEIPSVPKRRKRAKR